MKKTLGILAVVLAVVVFTSLSNPSFLSAYNLENLLQRAALYGILGIGVSFVIIAGGIDLSIGSVIGLVGCIAQLLIIAKYDWPIVMLAILAVTAGIGLWHGLLVTKLRLQPFVVTLCGLLLYRAAARYISKDITYSQPPEFEDLRYPAIGRVSVPFIENLRHSVEDLTLAVAGGTRAPHIKDFELPVPLFILAGLGILAAVFLNRTIYGRYLFAIGRNEQAARFSGINTQRIVIVSYVLCSVIAGGIGGVLFLLYQKSIQPADHGNFYELYAIAAAVLGGCSLRGGEGSVLGVILGAALIPLLYNASNVLGIPTTLEFATIGVAILAGAIVDEVVKRIAAARRRRKEQI